MSPPIDLSITAVVPPTPGAQLPALRAARRLTTRARDRRPSSTDTRGSSGEWGLCRLGALVDRVADLVLGKTFGAVNRGVQSPAARRNAGSRRMSGGEKDIRLYRREAVQSLGNSLRLLRERRGLSQEAVAISAGISTHAYGCLERGKTPSGADANPTFDTLIRVCRALEIEPPSLPSG